MVTSMMGNADATVKAGLSAAFQTSAAGGAKIHAAGAGICTAS
jgi:hypothetical protein